MMFESEALLHICTVQPRIAVETLEKCGGVTLNIRLAFLRTKGSSRIAKVIML